MKALSHILFQFLILHVLLWGNFYYPCFMDVETEANIH